MQPEVLKESEKRFWGYVEFGDGCWEWQGSRDKDGYGHFKVQGRVARAHRVSWALHMGEWPQAMVCHSCDNPSCVRPDHLWVGSNAENQRDAVVKGRRTSDGQPGELNPNSKLSHRDAVNIVAMIWAGHTNKEIAESFGVSHSTVSLIRRGKAWKEALEGFRLNENFNRYGSIRKGW